MGKSTVTHDFHEQLAYSQEVSAEGFWDAVYRAAYPDLLCHMATNADSQAQRLGIDRVLFFRSGLARNVDEKKRRTTYDPPDFLLEYVSNDKTGAKGWVEKDLQIDVLAYAFMDSRTVYLLHWTDIRRVWSHFREKWIATAEGGGDENISNVKHARNEGYDTLSLTVEREYFLGLLGRAQRVVIP